MSAMSALHEIKQEVYYLVNSCIECPAQYCSDTCAEGLQMELDAAMLAAFEVGRDYYEEMDQSKIKQVSRKVS